MAQRWAESDSAVISGLHRAGEAALRPVPHARARAGLLRRYRTLLHRGDRVQCPLCGSRFRHFMSAWNRGGAICWRCGSHERHRGLWLHLQRHPGLLGGAGSLLHFSPEWCLESRLRPLVGPGYVTAELEPGRADLALDITALALPDARLDAIVCSHVLEHVPDDAAAMRELVRVLRPGGWAIVMVPVDTARSETYEDPAVVAPEDRRREFWQHDHVRLYAGDISGRLSAAGFVVARVRPAAEAGPAATTRYGLLATDDLFVCRRPG